MTKNIFSLLTMFIHFLHTKMAEKKDFVHLLKKINNPTVMADDIACYKQYKKELDEISEILLTPSVLSEKCDLKYKK